MTIQDAQTTVDKWIKEYGVRYFDEMTNTLLLSEEVGEFSRLIARQYGEQSFKKSRSEEEVQNDIADEMADILFVLICLANQMGIDLETAMKKNLEKKTSRDKDRHKSNKKLKD
ncbi:nucleotide pyrophosphohydrolase [Saprospiraceae bacterium]|nr:nucleotide pyrophosphohydrolase [Saprospiraceae bacterium]